MNRYTKRYKNLDEFCEEFHTVEDLLRWYKANKVKWPPLPESGDANDNTFSWPDKLLRTKTGNCWDHGLFMHYFCEKNRIEHKLLNFQVFFETRTKMLCMGHCIGLYKSSNGINFFDITGVETQSKEYGPFKSYKEAIDTYLAEIGDIMAFRLGGNNSLYKVHKQIFWYTESPDYINRAYAPYYNKYNVTQNQVFEAICEPELVKKYGTRYPRNLDQPIERSWIEVSVHAIKKWIADYVAKPLISLSLPSIEMAGGLASMSTPVGINNQPFVMQLMSPTFVRPKYAVQNDILTDKVITTKDDDTLSMMSSDYLKDKSIRLFKYKKNDGRQKLDKILESVGKQVDRTYLYEAISGKEMLTDDQLYIDPDFEEVKFDELIASVESAAYSVWNKFISSSPAMSKRYPKVVVESAEAANKLKGHSSDVVIIESSDLGYYACNRKTLNRTGYYKTINDIVIGSDIDE